LTVAGSKVTMDDDQYRQVSDKFVTEKEWSAMQEKGEAPAPGATALDDVARAAMEQTTPEAHAAAQAALTDDGKKPAPAPK
jgi:hypothetical protein